jgi:hypothetical protein
MEHVYRQPGKRTEDALPCVCKQRTPRLGVVRTVDDYGNVIKQCMRCTDIWVETNFQAHAAETHDRLQRMQILVEHQTSMIENLYAKEMKRLVVLKGVLFAALVALAGLVMVYR